jgi:aspartyl-tRNA(Asn)/glutamyl-tRNA(Gln) amidotransferase subunit A
MIADDVLDLTVRELGDRIKSGQLSPVELARAYLRRSERVGPALIAYVRLTPERALREAEAAEREIKAGRYRGPLHGIPYAAKDLMAAKGYPTTWGAKPYADRVIDIDATVVARLGAAGAVLLGKSATVELAGGFNYRYADAAFTGPGKNPWDATRWAGGSSSGSGTVAAAGLAGFALGTETWGSVVCPAAFCGATGLRPTYGRVSRAGVMPCAWSMDKVGVLARSADCCALVLAALAGPDPLDPASHPDGAFRDAADAPARPLRVGWVAKAWAKLPRDLAAATDAAREVLRKAGATVEEAELPPGPWDEAAGLIVAAEVAAAHHALIESGRVAELRDAQDRVGGYVAQQAPAADYLRAQRIRGVLQRKADALFERFDILAAPTMPIGAPPLTADLADPELFGPADPLGAIGNLCGLPAVSVPCGFTDGKLPVGVVFVGRALADATALAAARLYQKQTDWHRRRPPAPG